MTEELKPCAHCGGKASMYEWVDENEEGHQSGRYCISCDKCPIQTDNYSDKEELIAAWNLRVEPDKLPEWLAKRLRNMIYGYLQAGDGKDYRDGYYAAIVGVLSLKRGE